MKKKRMEKKKDFDHDGSLAAVTASEKGYLKCAFEYCEDLKKFDVLQNDYESALLRFDVSEKNGKGRQHVDQSFRLPSHASN